MDNDMETGCMQGVYKGTTTYLFGEPFETMNLGPPYW